LISETPDFANSIYLDSVKNKKLHATPSVTKFKIGQKYYWKVICSSPKGTTESAVFSFQTEDLPPRWISLNGKTSNVRDLGGYRTVDGRRVKQNMLLRGRGLNDNSKDGKTPGKNRLNDADLDYFLKKLKVRTDLDLRSTKETAGMKVSPLGKNVQYIRHNTPIYGKIFTNWGKGLMAANFRVFCDEANYPIYFHCAGGADRTGSLAFILEAILGFPEKEIELDYERTFYPYQRKGGFWKSYQPLKVGLMKYGKASDTFQKRAELYLEDCGITQDEIEKFRAIMLEN
jgi:protein-tyrosine phosphatase